MDADTLRAILSAQTAAQEKMLQAVMKEMRGMFSSMTSTSTTAHATSAKFVTNSLSARLPEFTHDSENGCTFDVWYSRYEDIITQDGATLDEAAKTRLIVSKLDAPAYTRFTHHILPRKAAEISLEETMKTLQELSGHNTSVFARRYTYLENQCNGESLRDYTGYRTDHKLHISNFGTHKGVPVYTANRLQRWATTLLNYNFSIQYVKTSEFGQADALSRLIGLQSPDSVDRVIASADADLCAEVMDNRHRTPVSFSSVQEATTADHTLIQVIIYIRSGKWPKVNRNSHLWPYYNR
uniref:Gag-pol polyprotein n=1 Tax=Haemonchus contortus TaxID=6289 RepID=W6NGA2_HAECO